MREQHLRFIKASDCPPPILTSVAAPFPSSDPPDSSLAQMAEIAEEMLFHAVAI